MRLKKVVIQHFRSIKHVEIDFPSSTPVVLFGPNNVGKSNILRGIDYLLGERHASYIDFQDSDYFNRDKAANPKITLSAYFDDNIQSRSPYSSSLHFSTSHDCIDSYTQRKTIENTYHYEDGKKMFLRNEDKEKCQFIFVDATRDISRQLSYFSQYSILSKMSKKMHSSMVSQVKSDLDKLFSSIKTTFESVPEYKKFYTSLQKSFENNVDGFEHKLDIDLSAYDPNNYFHSLRIIAREGAIVRSFDEFGTGEQQILLMSFIKAYAETFKGQNFILGIEEPEAHLHPIAQKWLARNINKISNSGIQTIITTHSPEFLDIENIEGFVKVYRKDNITEVVQNNVDTLTDKCLEMKAAPKTNRTNIKSFYKCNTFYDQLIGFFARKIILVEGPTELFSLINYFKNCEIDLTKNGVEIIDCRGKSQIARNYRLFKSYNYDCFCLFDADSKSDEQKRGNKELGDIFSFIPEDMDTSTDKFYIDKEKGYGYFGKDIETYLKTTITEYSIKEQSIDGTKPLKAKIMSETNPSYKPHFISEIAEAMDLTGNIIASTLPDTVAPDDIPF